jgi:Na+/H+ antiporter NhaD/arsenite permease-like protein
MELVPVSAFHTKDGTLISKAAVWPNAHAGPARPTSGDGPRRGAASMTSSVPHPLHQVAILVVVAAPLLVLHRRELGGAPQAPTAAPRPSVRTAPLVLTGLVAAGMLAAFLLAVTPAHAALAAAVLTMLWAGRRATTLIRQVDVQLLVVFAGLFVLVDALAGTPVAAEALSAAAHAGTLGLAGLVALASNALSNVPAVLLFLPAVRSHGGPAPALTLAMASTLAGNLTLVGSIGN